MKLVNILIGVAIFYEPLEYPHVLTNIQMMLSLLIPNSGHTGLTIYFQSFSDKYIFGDKNLWLEMLGNL